MESQMPPPQLAPIEPMVYVQGIPQWLMLLGGLIAVLLLIGLGVLIGVWWRRAHAVKPLTPGQKALAGLSGLENVVEGRDPYAFSAEVSDVLRAYVSEALALPATSQTSPEFLASVARHKRFTEAERELLAAFLEKADLIKFARFQASERDSRELLGQARDFVNGKESAA